MPTRDAPGARPECRHGCVFVGLHGEPLHMVCGCQPTPADVAAHKALWAAGWFTPVNESKK